MKQKRKAYLYLQPVGSHATNPFAAAHATIANPPPAAVHKCAAMPDGYLLRRHSNGDWYYQHLGDSQPIVEYCPHCGERLGRP